MLRVTLKYVAAAVRRRYTFNCSYVTFKLTMDALKRCIEGGRRYLVIELVTGTTQLMDSSQVFRRPGGAGLVQFVAVDIAKILEKFDRLAPARETFTLTEIAKMANEKAPTVNAWVRMGVLTPSVRDRDGTQGKAMLFSRLDAFVGCLVASLKRRSGLPLSKLQDVSSVLRGADKRRRFLTREDPCEGLVHRSERPESDAIDDQEQGKDREAFAAHHRSQSTPMAGRPFAARWTIPPACMPPLPREPGMCK